MLALSVFAHPVPSVVKVVYSRRHRCVVVSDGDAYYEDQTERHLLKTPYGLAEVTVDPHRFPDYPNVETGPEGFALSMRTPRRVAVEVRFKGFNLEVLNVDHRHIGYARGKTPHLIRFRLAGGQHNIELAWPPTE